MSRPVRPLGSGLAPPCRRAGRTRVGALGLAAVACLALAGPAARADSPERVLLIAPPAGLAAAVRAALSAWPIQVIVTGEGAGAEPADTAPGASMPSSADRARALAVRHGAGAVVWLSEDGAGGRALWVYDSESGRTSARRLTHPPPFDEPTAAAAALSVKTLLRHSSVVPPLERYGAPAALAGTVALAGGAPPHLRIDTAAGLRLRRSGAGGAEPRLGVGLRAAPGRLAELGALAAALHLGPGVSVDEPRFTGQFSDLQVSAALLARIAPAARVAIWPRLGGSLHVTDIQGAVPGQTARARARRLNPTVDAGAAVELAVRPWLYASIGGSASWLLRRQTYLVAGDPVLRLYRLELEFGAAVSVPLR